MVSTRPDDATVDDPPSVSLTDEELIAACASAGAHWPDQLPTIDPLEVDAARSRGLRSLYTRGFLDAEGRIAELLPRNLTHALADNAPRLMVYLADQELKPSSWGFRSHHIVTADGWLLNTVSPLGIHRLSLPSAEDHGLYLEAVLRGAHESGPENPQDGPTWLCALAFGASTTTVVRAQLGVVESASTQVVDGLLVPDEAWTTETPSSARALAVRTLTLL